MKLSDYKVTINTINTIAPYNNGRAYLTLEDVWKLFYIIQEDDYLPPDDDCLPPVAIVLRDVYYESLSFPLISFLEDSNTWGTHLRSINNEKELDMYLKGFVKYVEKEMNSQSPTKPV